MGIYQQELAHHGIKGQRWGIRRYQNPDGSYTELGKKKYFNSDGTRTKAGQKVYNYKESEAYKKGTRQQRASMTNAYNARQKMVGTRAANRIEYKRIEEGANAKTVRKMTQKELGKQALIGAAVYAGIMFGPDIARGIGNKIQNGRAYVYNQNILINQVAEARGLNEVKGGFTFGFDAVKKGKQFTERMMNMR